MVSGIVATVIGCIVLIALLAWIAGGVGDDDNWRE
jgi:hypothetical protein